MTIRKLLALPATVGLLFSLTASPALGAVTFYGTCGFQVSNIPGGSNVRSDAATDANAVVQNIYVHSEFYRDGVYLGTFNDDEVNRSHAEAWGNWNFSFGYEHPTYRVKSWHNIKVSGVWKTQLFCDYSWTKP